MMGRTRAALLACVGALSVLSLSCSNDWDLLDARAGSSTTGGATTGAGGGTTSSTTGNPMTTGAGAMGGVGAMGGMPGGGGTTATAGGDPMPQTVTYVADIARCVSTTTPDPDACELAEGAGLMAVDTSNIDLADEPTHGFVRFDLDNAFAGATILDVTLEVTVAAGNSTQSGELYQVDTFDLTTLQTAIPSLLTMLAADQGPVTAGQVVAWSIPNGLVSPDGSVFVGLIPINNNGVEYFSDSGNAPPTLTVTYR